jgi:hypothetical protein
VYDDSFCCTTCTNLLPLVWPVTKGDHQFLKEILNDLKEETINASDRILRGIYLRAFHEVEKASHIVKGSASFFFCTDLINAADKLVQLAREGLMLGIEETVKEDSTILSERNGQPCRDPKTIWGDIEATYIEFGQCVGALNVELEAHFNLEA